MRRRLAVFTFAAAAMALVFSAPAVIAQQAAQEDGPWWAYSFLTAPKPGEAARPCGDPPVSCGVARPAPQLDETPQSLPGAPQQYSPKQASEWYGPADWYPNDHPAMPPVVARGNEQKGVRACTLCHHPLGKGRPENAALAGLPAAYIVDQMAQYKAGTRKSADPRKVNTNEMIAMARTLSDEEIRAAADYYASMKWSSHVRVVESESIPKVVVRGGMYHPAPGGGTEPLGNRVIEIAERPEAAEYLRDPKMMWIAHVPVGSIKKGEELATSGGGRTMACSLCHGPDLNGVGNVPGIAGRAPSYMIRQMYDMQTGARQSALMGPVVAKLTVDDMIALAAYAASRQPR